METSTILDGSRQEKLKIYINFSNYLSGNIAEVGVYKGGSAEIIAKSKNKNKKLFIFDTFEGMPNVNEKDNHHKKSDFKDTSFEKVKQALSSYENVFVYKGIFPEKNSEIILNEKFSLVHLDVDIYESYKNCLEFFYPRLISGGLLILDDYNAPSCLGAKLAVDEFFNQKPEKPIWNTLSQAVIVKI